MGAPHVLHGEPGRLAPGTRIELFSKPSNFSVRTEVTFGGFETTEGDDVLLRFSLSGSIITVTMMPDPSDVDMLGGATRRADPSNPNELACEVPGELLSYAVKEGDLLVEGD